MKILKKIWKYLDGKKRNIGIVIMIGEMLLHAFAPTLLTPEQYTAIGTIGGLIAGGGTLHAIDKKQRSKRKIIKN